MSELVDLKVKEHQDLFPMLGTDYVEFYVGDAKKAAYYWMRTMGFQPLAYSGLETGNQDTVSYVLRQGKITIVLTGSYHPDTEVAEHVKRHGDGVKVYAITVEDARQAFAVTTERGAKPFMEPRVLRDDHGEVVLSGIYTYGETVHIFVERKNYEGIFMPGFELWDPPFRFPEMGFKYVDHAVGNVEEGKMVEWARFYENVMGFFNLLTFDDKDISTEYTALMSKVMSNGNGWIKFPINEPAPGLKKSQIQEYLEFYGGPGCQHLALATDNIIETITAMRENGMEFLEVPDTYYETLEARVGKIDEDIEDLRRLKILVDRDEYGYLLQLFTKPIQDRPTFFIEVIQRKGAKSFGKGNFKALFEAIEREQARRGTL